MDKSSWLYLTQILRNTIQYEEKWSGEFVIFWRRVEEELRILIVGIHSLISTDHFISIFFWNGIIQGSMVAQYHGCIAIKFQTANDSPDEGDTQIRDVFRNKNVCFFISLIKGGGVISVYKNLCCRFCIVQEAFLQQKWA